MALKKGYKRFSVDTTDETNRKIDELLKRDSISKSALISEIIENYVDLDDSTRSEIQQFCKKKHRQHLKESLEIEHDEYSIEKEDRMAKQYASLEKMYGRFASDNTSSKEIRDMKKMYLKDGYVVFPDGWIVVNPEASERSRYAYVIETVDLYNQFKMPHFIFFDDDTIDHVEQKRNSIFAEASRMYPRLNDILDKEVTPVYGKEDSYGIRPLLNSDEYNHAPKVLIFKIADAGNERHQDYPYNAKVYRENRKEI